MLSGIDFVVIAIYCVLMVGIATIAKRRSTTVDDYFAAGHKLPWWMAAISHHVSGYSAVVFVGFAGKAASAGISVWMLFSVPTFIAMMVGCFVWAPRWARLKGLTPVEYLERRHNKAVRRVRQAIEAGELGDVRIVSVRVRWCRPQCYYDMAPWRGTFSHDGGALTNQSIHHVDLIRHFGGEVSRVNATMRTLGASIEVEDTVAATIAFEGDAVGIVEATTAARPDDFEASLSIVGSKGLAQIGGIAVNELQVFTPDPAACAKNSEDFQGIEGVGAVYGHGHTQMYRDIVAFFGVSTPYPVSREDCLGTLKLLNAFYRSDEAGGWVDVADEDESPRLGHADEAVSDLYRTPPR